MMLINQDVLHLDIDYVYVLENSLAHQSDEDAILFFLGTTVLHEYVHYGDWNSDGVKFHEEAGIVFELAV